MIFLILLTLLNFYHFVDAGPKPSMKFNIKYETSASLTLEGGYQLESAFADFSSYDTLEALGPQRFECDTDSSCFSSAYGYDKYNKLILLFKDKSRESNIFTTEAYNASFDVIVKEDSLEIIETTPVWKRGEPVYAFLKALILTLLTEMSGAFVLFILLKIPRSLLWTLLVANFITLPLVWFVFPLIGYIVIVVILAEIFAIVFEAYFMNIASKKVITLGRAFIISIIVNFFSFFTGGLMYLLLFFL